MKAAEVRRVARAICATVPSLTARGRLLFSEPINHVLRGVYLENSSAPSKFYVWAFVQPLYVPSATVYFNFGKRLPSANSVWNVADSPEKIASAVINEGMPFIQTLTSPAALADWEFLRQQVDPHAREARAYSLIMSGRITEGLSELSALARSLVSELSWMNEMRERAMLLARLAEGVPSVAQARLAEWEAETSACLRLVSD